jgi:hypothetical protein
LVLRQFIQVFSTDLLGQDPLLQLTRMLHAKLLQNDVGTTDPPMPRIRIYDVEKNSLANHGIQLHALLSRVSMLHIFDESYFLIDHWLLQHGNLRHKFLRDLRTDRKREITTNRRYVNAMHFHFFPFMAGTEAGRMTILTIIGDLRSELNTE